MSIDLLGNLALVLLFVLVGGVFAATEIALVSLREGQIRAMAERSQRGVRVARLAADPNRYLASVQVGVTVAGFFSAAFGAATLADDLAPVLAGIGLSTQAAATTSLILITLLIAYLSLVLGELVPKRLALQRTEGVSMVFGPPLDRLSWLLRPVVWLLSRSTDVVVRVFGGDPSRGREAMSGEELRELVTGHEGLGEEERRIVEDVFEAGDRQVREVMLPRTEVAFLDAGTPVAQAARFASARPHSRYPVIDGTADEVLGFVHIRDLWDPELGRRDVTVGDLARQVLPLPGTKPVLASLSEMQRRGIHLAIVVDEYGGTDGIVTLEDLVEELVGDIYDEYDVPGEPAPTQPRLGTVTGLLNLDAFAERTGVRVPEGPYETVAGFLVARLGRLPKVGDFVQEEDHRFTVVAMDGRRIEQIEVAARTRDEATP